ncbi:MAG: DUF4249 domain-containing protein [Saprospiraceae bacterium]|nr:DUF4249 domain-containing protein [Saprospiraceae bacterium]
MKIIFNLIILSVFVLLLTSCEESYVPDTSISQQEIVVEGYVEVGEGSNPTFVLLTKSIPFISTIEPDKFTELFIRDATVTVFDGDKTVALNEICLNDIPEELKEQVYEVLGFDPDSNAVDICVYADLFGQITKEYGRRYDLTVVSDGKTLTAHTTIPQNVGLYDFKWGDPPGSPSDTLVELSVKINDPANIANYYRYLTATQGQQLIPPFGSVTDDAIFDGKEFEFPLQKAERRGGDFDPETFGLFVRGDSVVIKWCTLDKAHFDFWNTRDFSANSGGPFSSYTRIATNIKGGLGIWGGYAVNYYRLLAPPK